MAPTTTFQDIKFTEPVENYNFERQTYSFDEGQVVSMPKHTANNFANKWNMAVFEGTPYEIRDDEYDDVVMRLVDGVEEEVYECDVCGDEFDSEKGVKAHKAQVH